MTPKPGRRAPRVRTSLDGSLSARSAHDVRVVDLSSSGCLVECDTLLDHGAILDLRLRLEGDPFAAKVRVTEAYLDGSAKDASGHYLAGLEFLALPVRAEARLLRFLDAERRKRGAHSSAH